jgi:hypothetical protein
VGLRPSGANFAFNLSQKTIEFLDAAVAESESRFLAQPA